MSSRFGFRNPQQQLDNAMAVASQFQSHGLVESAEARSMSLDRFRAAWAQRVRILTPIVSDIMTDYISTVFGLETFVRGNYVYNEWAAAWVYVWQPGSGFNMPALQVWLTPEGNIIMVWPEGGYPEKGKLCEVLQQQTGLTIAHCVNETFTL